MAAPELFRLTGSYLKLGVPLPGDILDEAGHLLLTKGQVLENADSLAHLLERGMFVDLSTFEAHFKSQAPAPAETEQRYDPFAVHASLKTRLNRLLREILEKTSSPDSVYQLARAIMEFSGKDVEAAIASALLDRHDEVYPIGHSLSAATLCAALAKKLEWDESRQISLVCAALTMNLGMQEYHVRLHRQASSLSSTQLEQLQGHPDQSLALLKAIGVEDPVWLGAVAQHHEKADGTGYPKHMAAPEETPQLLRITDIFDARIHARGDRKAAAPAQVLKSLFVDEGKGPSASFVNALVKMTGLYPPGSFVKLANNEHAVVFRHGEGVNTPVVAAVTNASGGFIMAPVRRETHRMGLNIVSTFVPEHLNFGYDLGKLWITRR